MQEIFRIENLTKEYIYNKKRKRKTIALNNISFKIYQGSTTAIVGESGSGKSTLCQILSGLEEVYEGNVFYNGENIIKIRKTKKKKGKKA